MLTPYPTEFPRESLTMLLDAVRGKVPEMPELAHACWNVAGFALGKTLGGGPVIASSTITDEEVLSEALKHDAPAGVSEGLFPWGLVVSIALKLLSKYAL
jgi:hypothetical protein